MPVRSRAALFFGPVLFALACGGDDPVAGGGGAAGAGASGGSSSSSGGGGQSGATDLGPVWIINGGTKTVAIVDGKGGTVWSEDLASRPLSLRLDAGAAWIILEQGGLVRYDLATHTKQASVEGIRKPTLLAAAGGKVWVVDEDADSCGAAVDAGSIELLRIDAATNTIASRQNLHLAAGADKCARGDRIDGLTADGQAAFAIVNNGFGVMRVDATTGLTAGTVKLGLEGGYGFGNGAVTSTTLWVVDGHSHRLLDLDPKTLVTRASVPVPADVSGAEMTASDAAV